MDTNANVSLVKKIYDLFMHGDVDGILANLSDDITWVEPAHPEISYGGTRHGESAVREFFA